MGIVSWSLKVGKVILAIPFGIVFFLVDKVLGLAPDAFSFDDLAHCLVKVSPLVGRGKEVLSSSEEDFETFASSCHLSLEGLGGLVLDGVLQAVEEDHNLVYECFPEHVILKLQL